MYICKEKKYWHKLNPNNYPVGVISTTLIQQQRSDKSNNIQTNNE